jgi:hypothetical protein
MPKEQTPPKVPIEQAIKNILLEDRQIPPWLENMFADVSLELTGDYPTKPIEENPVYQTLWYFSKMTPEEIHGLDEQKLGRTLSMLEAEDQDDLARRLPSDLAEEFWHLITKYDFMNESD